jgi:hypothetical protein
LVQARIDEIKFFRDWKQYGVERLQQRYPEMILKIKHHPRGERAALVHMEDRCVVPQRVTFTENDGRVSWIKDPEAKLEDGAAEMYRPPRRGKRYLVVIDVAEGKQTSESESDDSIINVFDTYLREQVLEWGGIFDEEITAAYGVMIAKVYNNAVIVPEMNNKCGGLLWGKLEDTGYRHLYYRETVKGQKRSREPGWDTKVGVKKDVFGSFRIDFKNDVCLLHSIPLLEQMLSFMDVRGKLEAADGKKDDRVMTAGVGMKVISITPALRKPASEDEDDWLPTDYAGSTPQPVMATQGDPIGRYI